MRRQEKKLETFDICNSCIYNVYMVTKVKMWGNSLGVHIPKHVSEELRLTEGNDVQIVLDGKVITIKPIKKVKKETLHDLVKGITKKNRHEETDWGYPVGNELW